MVVIYVPHLPAHVRWSQKTMPKYYTNPKKLPKTYRNKEKYYWCNGKLYSKRTGSPMIQNKASVGKPNDQAISGNQIYSGTMHYQKRGNMIRAIKTYMIQEVLWGMKVTKDWPPKPWHLDYTFWGNDKQDLDNRWCYRKVLHDAMTTLEWWEDDNVHSFSKVSECWRSALFEDRPYSMLIKIRHDKTHY